MLGINSLIHRSVDLELILFSRKLTPMESTWKKNWDFEYFVIEKQSFYLFCCRCVWTHHEFQSASSFGATFFKKHINCSDGHIFDSIILLVGAKFGVKLIFWGVVFATRPFSLLYSWRLSFKSADKTNSSNFYWFFGVIFDWVSNKHETWTHIKLSTIRNSLLKCTKIRFVYIINSSRGRNLNFLYVIESLAIVPLILFNALDVQSI